MILWIDKWNGAYEAAELNDRMIQGINDGILNAYRLDSTTGHYQKHDGSEWVTISW